MRMYDIICKKRNGLELSEDEIKFMINAYSNDKIPDYQMSAMLMAIYLKGMSDKETSAMTMAMAQSGEIVDLSPIKGIKVDKHSTGGVGDKTTLIIAPIVAHYGVKVAKMSGRGLGHTGGTIDKMEAIPNLKTDIPQNKFFDIVNEVGASVISQSQNLAPADKKLYHLRDVTATVDSIPLIATSIMSKKIASGSDCILLDVKTGSGAFMKTLDDSIELAKKMVAIGENCGKKTIALITDMDIPLGKNIGNSLEIKEVIETLKGNGPKDLTEISIKLAGNMLFMANKGTLEECFDMAKQAINSGSALNKLAEMVKAQGGNEQFILNPENFEEAKIKKPVLSDREGYISNMDTELLGIASSVLGAGRETKDDVIDFSAGIILEKKYGDYVKKGDVLAYMFTSDEEKIPNAQAKILQALQFENDEQKLKPLILAMVQKENVEKYV